MIDPIFIHIAQAAETATEEVHKSGVIGTLGLNLQLFVAQLVNFGIVMLVLWKWVFTPVTQALKARTDRIEKSLQTAEKTEQDRAEFEKWKAAQLSKARQEAAEIIRSAKDDADALKASMLVEAKDEQETLMKKGRKQMEAETSQAIQAMKAEMADLVTKAAESVLKQTLDSAKDKKLISETIGGMK